MTDVLDDVLEDLAAGHPDFAVGPPRFTARQWRTVSRAQRKWRRRAASATVAVIVAEVACALAWTAWSGALAAKWPDSPDVPA